MKTVPDERQPKATTEPPTGKPMEIFRCADSPEKDYSWGTSEEFSNYDLEDLRKTGAQVAFYWYVSGSYEGSGQLLLFKDGRWYLHDCGHCSCYGPTEDIKTDDPIDTLDGVQARCSKELWPLVEPLVKLAESKGYGKPSDFQPI